MYSVKMSLKKEQRTPNQDQAANLLKLFSDIQMVYDFLIPRV